MNYHVKLVLPEGFFCQIEDETVLMELLDELKFNVDNKDKRSKNCRHNNEGALAVALMERLLDLKDADEVAKLIPDYVDYIARQS